MPLPTQELGSSPARKLRAWLIDLLSEAGLTDPVLEEDSGDDIPEGRHILVSVSSPAPVIGLEGLPPGVAPLASEAVLALILPAVNKVENTPDKLHTFDKLGRSLADIFRVDLTGAKEFISIDKALITGEGSDASQVDQSGRTLRVHAVIVSVEFIEITPPD